MLIYEVTATVEAGASEDYERYMKETHIPDVMRTGAFTSAHFERSVSGDRYRTRYACLSREMLDQYLEKDAPDLRADFTSHFDTGVKLVRDQWQVVATFA